MIRLLALLLPLALLAPTPAQAKDPQDRQRPPEMGWSAKRCKAHIRAEVKTLKADVRASNAKNRNTLGENPEANAELYARLDEIQTKVEARLEAQAEAGGKWKGRKTYGEFSWKGRRFNVAGCPTTKKNVPLKRLAAMADAPETKTDLDQTVGTETAQFIQIKKARTTCKAKKDRGKRATCLRRYIKHKWLDRYPMGDADATAAKKKKKKKRRTGGY